jgi:hypothetical protein
MATDADLPEDLQRRKDTAGVVKEEADADKARADAAKAQAEADLEAAKARREQLAGLIPDLSQVTGKTLEVKEGPPLRAAFLTYHALRNVAEAIAMDIGTALAEGSWRVLVTGDSDLASADAVHREVSTGLRQLIATANKLVEEFTKPEDVVTIAGFPLTDAIAALAGAVPAVLSLLSAHRTVSTAPATVTDLAAAAAVAGAVATKRPGGNIVHDDFRLVPGGGVFGLTDTLSEKRQILLGFKLKFADDKATSEAQHTAAEAIRAELAKALAAAGTSPSADLIHRLEVAEQNVVLLARTLKTVAVRLAMVDSVIGSIDTYVAAIRAVPQGAHRSPLATAALYDLLHPAEASTERFTHVLLVKSEGGQAEQVTSKRPLWWRDRFSVVVDVSVTYLLVGVPHSGILAAGTVTRTAAVQGKIGGRFAVKVEASS